MRKLIPALALLFTACQDLEVTNPNAPDAARATSQPAATEAFVASSFRKWWPVAGHDDYPAWAFSTIAWEVTSGFADFGQLELSAEPRAAWNNSPVNARNNVSEEPWFELYGALSAVNDAVYAIEHGLIIRDSTATDRARAFGKFMQGLTLGYLGLYFDSAYVVDEHVDVDTVTVPKLEPYPDVIAAAIKHLDSAIVIAKGRNFNFEASNWFFTAITRDQFIRLAHSFAARLMVYQARTPAERAAVDWAKVIARVDSGITTDFAPVGQPDILWHDWQRLVARVRNALRPSDFGRPSYWTLGPADSANGWVNWVAAPVGNRTSFKIRSKDRRIRGAANDSSPGLYVGYNRNNIFTASRGTYRFSWYYFHRYGTGDSWQAGAMPAMLVTEMRLLRAEALMRTGLAAQALPLINASRTANGQLPNVTVDGPPDEPGCVPRKMSGACGSLWDALRYEKRIEGLGVSGVIAYFDARGWGELPQYSITQLPVPGRELAILQRPLYSYGGPGDTSIGSAAAPNPEKCPTGYTSARCP